MNIHQRINLLSFKKRWTDKPAHIELFKEMKEKPKDPLFVRLGSRPWPEYICTGFQKGHSPYKIRN